MRFQVLGPVEAYAGDQRLALGGPKPRVLLAALLTEPGRIVPTERLVDIVWGDHPPETCRALVHTYISTLRRVLNRPGTDDVIVTSPPGYLVRVGTDDLDSAVFERLVATARGQAHARSYPEAVDSFRDAERLWHGAAFAGFGESLFSVEAARLDELRLAAIDERITAEMTLGRNDDLVVELTALVGTHPTHERLRAHLMVVLYRLGRQADALATYRSGRENLIEQLGIEPGPELRRVHDAILRCDPSLIATPPHDERVQELREGPSELTAPSAPRPVVGSGSTGTEPGTVPAQLPAFPADFTGRDNEIADVTAALTRRPDSTHRPDANAAVTCVIAGKGGAGKSALALRVAHEIADAFPDGQLYAELRGTTDTPAQPGEVLGRFLRALGADPATLPDSVDERIERFRTALAGRRVLVVLDDAANEQQIRPLLPGGPGTAVLLTARPRLPGLAGAAHTELDVLNVEEAIELLARITGEGRVLAEPDAAEHIVALCGCLPLAVRFVGARLATRRHWSLASMATRLADERRRLDELSVADQQVRAGIEVTYRGLDGDAQAALRGLGMLGLPDFPGWLVSCLLDRSVDDGEQILEQLVDAQLIDFARSDAVGQPRYRLHELVRVYARERAGADDEPSVSAESIRRVIGCWLWLIGQISDSAPTGSIPLNPPTGDLDNAHELSLEALAILRDLGDDLLVAYALQSLAKTLVRLGRGQEALPMLAEALETCARLGDRWGEAFLMRTRGELHLAAGRWAAAGADLTDSIRRWISLDVPLFRARTERDLASLREAEGDAKAAARLRSAALETFRTYGAREFGELALTGDL